MVAGEDAIVFGEGTAAVDPLLDAGVDGDRQVHPVDEVFAVGVAPVLALVLGRVLLIEQVIAPLPGAEPVGIVGGAFWIHVVVGGTIGIRGLARSRLGEADRKLIRSQLLELFLEACCVGAL